MHKRYISSAVALLLASGVFATTAFAATTVTSTNTQGWSTADTTAGGSVSYVTDSTSPYPNGALSLSTGSTTTAKAQYLTSASTTLSSITQISYYTKQVAGPSYADPSYQLLVDLNGASAGGFTTFVYEPYQQASSTITQGAWQQWNVAAGQFWSSRSFTDGTCSVTAGAGGAPFYTLSGLKAACPNAVVVGYGVNVGSNNPGYTVYADGVNFNGNVSDFQMTSGTTTPPSKHPTNASQCKKGGWKTFKNPSYKNQGQCVSSLQKSKHTES